MADHIDQLNGYIFVRDELSGTLLNNGIPQQKLSFK